VSPAVKYKAKEKEIVGSLGKKIRKTFSAVSSFFKLVIHKGRQRFTVMFIPHSEKKIFNFHISVFSLVFVLVLIVALVVAFFTLSTHYTASGSEISRMSDTLEKSEGNLDDLKDEIFELSLIANDFEHKMEELLSVINSGEANPFQYQGAGGDLSSFLGSEEVEDSVIKEKSELRNLRAFLKNLTEPIAQITEILSKQRDLLIDIPTLWPVKNGQGYFTAFFGPEEHPFTKGFRLHNGVDIAAQFNTPIVATANGKVYSVAFEPNGLGHCITLSHKYGFSTRYGHLSKSAVRKGDKVSRGQIIGYMGSTGNSTGTHLHYEVWMGPILVDPMDYLDINSPLVSKKSYGR
jgi:murein DD-endopeptidase MepM/ murein hydrolase activator NlpD